MTNSKTIEFLKNIAELCIDGIQGYKDAAERTEIPYIKSLFTIFIKERESILNGINKGLTDLGASTVTQGKTDGIALDSIHKFWLDFQGVLSSNNIESILEECKRGEKYILDEVDDILKNQSEIPTSSIQIIKDARYTLWKRVETIEYIEEISE